MKTILCLVLVVYYLASCTNGVCKPWDPELETKINFERLMENLEQVTFKEHSIQIKNCSTGEGIMHDYVIDHTSNFLWEKRHDLYDKYHEILDECKDCEVHPTLDLFKGCLAIQRNRMIRDIPVIIETPIKEFLNQIKQEELDKCNNIPS